MMAQQLKETTMDIKTRSLIRVTVPNSDYKKTNKLISNIMGKKCRFKTEIYRRKRAKS